MSALRSNTSAAGDPVRAGTRLGLGFRRRLQVDAAIANRQPEVQHMAQQLLSSVQASLTSKASGFLRSVACRVNINLSNYPLLNSMLPVDSGTPPIMRPSDSQQQPQHPALALPGQALPSPMAPDVVAADAAAANQAPLLQQFLHRADRLELLYACLLSDLSNMAYDVFKVEDGELLRHNLTLVSTSLLPMYGPVRQEVISAAEGTADTTSTAVIAAAAATDQVVKPPSLPAAAKAKAAKARSVTPARPSRQRRSSGQQVQLSATARSGPGLQAAATSPPRSSARAVSPPRSPSRSHLPASSSRSRLGIASTPHALPAAAAAPVCDDVPPAEQAKPLAAAAAAAAATAPFSLLRGPWPWKVPFFVKVQAAAPTDKVAAPDAVPSDMQVAASDAAPKGAATERAAIKTAAIAAAEPAKPAIPPPPAAWFAADDLTTKTRYLVIQGSTSLEHWAINLKFEPVPFEDPSLGVRVHRGMYEAAVLLYDELLPLVRQHLASSPDARVALGGHSLGGSIASVLMLLLVMREGIDPARLAPSYSFGAPAVFCAGGAGHGPINNHASTSGAAGGMAAGANATATSAACGAAGATSSPPRRSLMARLGIPETLLTNVVMHKDIVPRAFLCNYTIVADFLKRFMPSFKDHYTLASSHEHKYLYTYIGTVSVLRPDDDAPFVDNDAEHPHLPSEAGLYKLRDPYTSVPAAHEHAPAATLTPLAAPAPPAPASAPAVLPSLRAALLAFMDHPHPLQYLSSLSSYGSDGTISRYHNPANYTRGLARLLQPRSIPWTHLSI